MLIETWPNECAFSIDNLKNSASSFKGKLLKSDD